MTRINRWWTVISGASRFINDIVDAVTEGGSVIVKNSADVLKQAGNATTHRRSNQQGKPYDRNDSKAVQKDALPGELILPHGLPFAFVFWSERQ